jgi:hypothetical protein
MKRMVLIARRHRVAALAALAILVVAGSVAMFSGAIFNYKTANPANVFTAGNLHHTNSADAAAILTATNMKPGDTANGSVTITNDGTLDGTFSLLGTVVTDTAPNGGHLSDVLALVVKQDGTQIYSGLAKNFATGSALTLTPNPWPVAGAHTFAFTVTFPDGGTPADNTHGDNVYKQSSLSISYAWTEVQ